MANQLYRCSISGKSISPDFPTTVLMRLYGEHREIMVDDIAETLAFLILGERGIGPKFLGTFDGGRLEEYIPVCNQRGGASKGFFH